MSGLSLFYLPLAFPLFPARRGWLVPANDAAEMIISNDTKLAMKNVFFTSSLGRMMLFSSSTVEILFVVNAW